MRARRLSILASIPAGALLGGSSLWALPAAAQDIPEDQMVDLGTPGEGELGDGRGTGSQVSDDGRTVMGYIQRPDGSVRLVIWRDGVLIDITPEDVVITPGVLDYLPLPVILLSGDGSTVIGALGRDGLSPLTFRYRGGSTTDIAQQFIPFGISGDGTIAVGSTNIPDPERSGYSVTRAVRYTDAGLEILDPLAGDRNSMAWAISADGRIAVGQSNSSGTTKAVRWVGTTVEDLGRLDDFERLEAHLVNADGSVIAGTAYTYTTSRPNHGFVWRDGVMSDLGTLGGDQTSVHAISADGSTIIGQSAHTNPDIDPAAQAYYWRDGAMHEIGYLPTDHFRGSYTIARAVSGDGSVIVGVARAEEIISGNYNSIAFRWQDGEITSLGTLGGHSSYATDVSTDGTTIVGWAENAADERRPFIYRSMMQDFSNLIASFALQADEAEVMAQQQSALVKQIAMPGCDSGAGHLCVGAGAFGFRSGDDGGTGVGRRSTAGARVSASFRLNKILAIGGAFGWADPEVRGDRQNEGAVRAWSVSTDLGNASRWTKGFGGRLWYAHARERLDITRGEGFDNVEPLSGSARQKTDNFGGEVHYAFEVPGGWTLAAAGSVVRSRTERDAYAETGGDYPAQYDTLHINRTVAQASIGAANPLGTATGWFEVGAETDIAGDPVTITGTSEIPGMESFALTSALKRADLRGTMRGGISVPLGPVSAGIETFAVTPVYGDKWQVGAAISLNLQL